MSENTPVTIIRQGASVINQALVEKAGEDVAAIKIDLATKHCTVIEHVEDADCPTLSIVVSDRTPGSTPEMETDVTVLALPAFKGWTIWSESLVQYTLKLCLTKDVISFTPESFHP